MCTLTFLPTDTGFVLTSNRDEHFRRETRPPAVVNIAGTQVIMPVDTVSEGSWIGVSKDKCACLLNGGFTGHHKSDFPDTVSRGFVIKLFFESKDTHAFLHELDCQAFEPFTLVVWDISLSIPLHKLVWDGKEKHLFELDSTEPFIVSSSTLYNAEVRLQRAKLFEEELHSSLLDRKKGILQLHTSSPLGKENGFLMERDNGIKTVSVCQIERSGSAVQFDYWDLKSTTPRLAQRLSL